MLHTTKYIVHKDMKIIKFHVCIDVQRKKWNESKLCMMMNYAFFFSYYVPGDVQLIALCSMAYTLNHTIHTKIKISTKIKWKKKNSEIYFFIACKWYELFDRNTHLTHIPHFRQLYKFKHDVYLLNNIGLKCTVISKISTAQHNIDIYHF